MTSDSPSRWAPSRQAKYLAAKASEADQRHARTTGESVARDLDRIWSDLMIEEIGLLDFLLSKDAPKTFIAAFDEPLFKSLVERGLLQLPRGVGGSWMRALRTSFQIAPAIREQILSGAEQYFGKNTLSRRKRREKAEAFMKSKAEF